MRRLVLVRHAATSATRAAAFPADEPLDERGREAASALGSALPTGYEAMTRAALRCRQTAEAAGLVAAVAPELAECDFGRWAGRSLAAVHDDDPAAAASWMTDPEAAPHGGESLACFAARVGRWLDAQSTADGGAVAITHAGVVKAAVVHALDAPLSAFWRVDVAPLTLTELHAHDGRWTVTRVNDAVELASS